LITSGMVLSDKLLVVNMIYYIFLTAFFHFSCVIRKSKVIHITLCQGERHTSPLHVMFRQKVKNEEWKARCQRRNCNM